MPDPSHKPYQPMLIIRPDSLPRFWWLNPWRVCLQLHKNAVALREMADRQADLLNGKYAERPRWQIVPNEDANGVKYYFQDTDPELNRGKPNIVFLGKTFLYDGKSKYFAFETDAHEAIARVTELNSK